MDPKALRLIALAVTSCLSLGACEHVNRFFEQLEPPKGEALAPGRKLVMLPDKVWELEQCETRPLPYIRLDETEITPKTVKPGASVVYKLSYTACVPQLPGYILGQLNTTVRSDTRIQNSRSDERYPVETGKWIVNTKISIPDNASPGFYFVEATISAYDETVRDIIGFVVEP
jgi:hypothetical protein